MRTSGAGMECRRRLQRESGEAMDSSGHDNMYDMDGTLGISCMFDDMSGIVRIAKLWELQDYEMGVWSFKYQIKLPVLEMTSITDSIYYYPTVMAENGDVLISKGKLVDKFLWDGVCPNVTGHWFRENLVSHAFFQMQDGACQTATFFPRAVGNRDAG
uniref:F-box associated domain-containing protein n=1 Tax=Leersia perrieri TaxID=77586 RepID=A0A0D9W2K2_9ORYZ